MDEPKLLPETANFASRLKAVLLDSLLTAIIIISSAPLFHKLMDNFGIPYLSGILVISLIVLYEPLWITLFGRTPGHFIFGLRVMNKDGKNPNFFQALFRWIIKSLFGIFAFLTMAGKSNRSIHDHLTNTSVCFVSKSI